MAGPGEGRRGPEPPRPTIGVAAGALSGGLTALAFPPTDAGWLGFVSLVPLAWAWNRIPPRYVAAASAAYGVVFFGVLLAWIRLFGLEAYLALVLALTAFVVVALTVGRVAALAIGGRWASAVFPFAFLAGEYARSRWLLGGFGWGVLGYAQHDNRPVLRLAAYLGVWGVSLLGAATAALVERALTRAGTAARGERGEPGGGRGLLRPAALLAGAAALTVLPAALPVPAADGTPVRVAAVQGNAPESTVDPHADDGVVLRSHLDLTAGLADADPALVLWSESSVERDPFGDPAVGAALADAARTVGAPMLVGAATDEPGNRFRNSTLLYTPGDGFVSRYDKQALVPFGEYVPFRRVLVPLVDELRRVPRDGIPGTDATVFRIPGAAVSTAICFESTFPGIVSGFVQRGARLLVVSTNDSSYARTPAAEQHLAFAQVRAAEHRMPVVQVALTGISAFVAPDGAVTARTGLFEPAALVRDVRPATGRTVYGRLGDWLPIASLAGILVLAAARVRRR